MKAEILKFPNKPLRGYAASPRLKERFHCVACESERYFVTVDLELGCASCGAIVINLAVVKR